MHVNGSLDYITRHCLCKRKQARRRYDALTEVTIQMINHSWRNAREKLGGGGEIVANEN